jgi:tetratricopeptide (TPR) repeat protein
LSDCERSLLLRPNDYKTLDSRAFVDLKSGNWDSAIENYNLALKIQPRYANSLYGRGIARQKKGDHDGGDADIKAAKAVRGDIVEAFKRLGVE